MAMADLSVESSTVVMKSVLKRHLPTSAYLFLREMYQLAPLRLKREFRREHALRKDFLWNAFSALRFNGIPGDYAEFGCCGANTFCMAYKIATKSQIHGSVGPIHFWAFDSFQGFPASSANADEHPAWKEGIMSISVDHFHRICRLRGVPKSAYTVVPGFYNETLTKPEGPWPEKIGLAYIDCDMYSSTKDVLQFLMPRLQHGMIIAFDDYYCYSSSQISGERCAASEMFDKNPTWRLYPFIHFGWHGMSFIVEHKNASAPVGMNGY
jgi:hypothetical protein